jgi:hypothetical protein
MAHVIREELLDGLISAVALASMRPVGPSQNYCPQMRDFRTVGTVLFISTARFVGPWWRQLIWPQVSRAAALTRRPGQVLRSASGQLQ